MSIYGGKPVFGALLSIAIALLVAAAPALAAGASPTLTPESACASIRDSLKSLAAAEQNQALALRLFSKGDSEPAVQTRLNELVAKSTALRDTLRSVKASKVADAPKTKRCLELGQKTLAAAERLSSQVEQVLYDRGFKPQVSSTDKSR